jgi:hypothetical protein
MSDHALPYVALQVTLFNGVTPIPMPRGPKTTVTKEGGKGGPRLKFEGYDGQSNGNK